MSTENSSDQRMLTRQELLKHGAVGAVGLSALGLAACGGGNGGGGTTASQDTNAQMPSKPTGTLRAGFIGLGNDAGNGVDPDRLAGNAGTAATVALFDPLWQVISGKLVMGLAEAAEPSPDGTTWDVTLREGVEFQNGKPFGPEDVIYSLHRKSKPTAAGYSIWGALKSVKKTGPRNVRIVFAQPRSTLLSDAGQPDAIVPVDFDPTKPVGTGPYSFVSVDPGRQVVLQANPNWWRQGQDQGPYAERLELVEFADDAARLNALLADQLDVIDSTTTAQLQTIEGRSNLAVVSTPSESATIFGMNAEAAPFGDVRVRQAMRLIVDRAAMNAQVLGGHGALGNDIMNPLSAGYIGGELPQREVDIEQAKALLKAAGQEDLQLELTTAPISTGAVEASQVLVEQAKAAGVTIKLKQGDPTSYYTPEAGYLSYPFFVSMTLGGTGYLGAVAILGTSTAAYNETHLNDPRYDQLYNEGMRTTDTDKRNEIIGEMQRIDYERGAYVIWGFAPNTTAFNRKVKGMTTKPTVYPMNDYRLNTLSVA